MAIGEKRPCAFCDREVEVVEEDIEGDVVHQKLSCGHPSNHTVRTVQEIVQSKDITIQAIAREGAAVQISGSSGISRPALLSDLHGTINAIGQLVIDSHDININFSPQHTATTTITTINSLQDIFSQVDKSGCTSEDKAKIKGVLSRVHDDLESLGVIMPVAAPFIPLIIKMLTHSA
jgi:hypothetical protein